MSREHNNENGQAIVEMVAGLIAIMLVFAGMIFISAVSVDSVRALITARENADAGNSSTAATSISSWDYGEDEIPFSSDDVPISGSAPNVMSSELNTNFMDLTTSTYTSDHAFTMGAQASNIYIDACNIRGSQGNNGTHIETVLDLFGEALENLFGISNIDVAGHRSNQVYMPQ